MTDRTAPQSPPPPTLQARIDAALADPRATTPGRTADIVMQGGPLPAGIYRADLMALVHARRIVPPIVLADDAHMLRLQANAICNALNGSTFAWRTEQPDDEPLEARPDRATAAPSRSGRATTKAQTADASAAVLARSDCQA